MALGHKTDGRKAGTPNRQTREISELLESLGHNPIEAMVQIATNPEASLELRSRMNAELASTSIRSVDVATDRDAPVMHKVVLEPRLGNGGTTARQRARLAERASN